MQFSKESAIKYVIFYNYARIKTDSYDSLLLEKTFALDVVILITTIYF